MTKIDKLLEQIGEDKHTNPATTSNKFKKDLYEFCKSEFPWTCEHVAAEFGTHKGQTTKILSEVFDKVYTVNLPDNFNEARRINADRDNIEYVGLDLYKSDVYDKITENHISLFLIDAGHSTDNVLTDFTRAINMNTAEPCYFVFDDCGLIYDVKEAVDSLIEFGKLEIVREIGHPKGYDFKNGRVLNLGAEGLICKLIN